MNGKILDFNTEAGSGLIRGDDGNRYEFKIAEFRSDAIPVAGMTIDFDVKKGKGVSVYAMGGPGKGSEIIGDKAKDIFSSVSQQIIHGDANATISYTPQQIRAATQGGGEKKNKVERPAALYTCNDCGTEISSRADACHQCGGPIPKCNNCGTALDLSVDQCGGCGKKADLPRSVNPLNKMAVSCPTCHGKAIRKHRGAPFVIALGGILLLSTAPIMVPFITFVIATVTMASFSQQALGGVSLSQLEQMAEMGGGFDMGFLLALPMMWSFLFFFVPFVMWAVIYLLIQFFGMPDFLRPQYACMRCTYIFRQRVPQREEIIVSAGLGQ